MNNELTIDVAHPDSAWRSINWRDYGAGFLAGVGFAFVTVATFLMS